MGVLKCARCQQFAEASTQKKADELINHAASSKVRCAGLADHLVWHENAIVENGKILLPNITTPKPVPNAEVVTERKKK